MNILSLHFGHDASATLMQDGKILSNISSERITRIKKDAKITLEVLEYIFKQSGLSYYDIDIVILSNYDQELSFKELKVFSDNQIVSRIDPIYDYEFLKISGVFFNKEIEIFCISHHLAHAASSYYTSNFDEAICFTLDSSSPDYNKANSIIAIGNKNKLNVVSYPETMISQIYTAFTAHLKLGAPYVKAGSLMGLAGYGVVNSNILNNYKKYVNDSYNKENMYDYYTRLWEEISKGLPTTPIEHVNSFEYYKNSSKVYNTKNGQNMAATAQFLFEKSIINVIEKIVKSYNIKNLCLAGGSFLNCNVNSLIKKDNWFENIHHCPASGDDGIALGSALFVAHHIFDYPREKYLQNNVAYMGNNYEVVSSIDYKEIANEIANGKIIAWFNGKSELGPRALGNRSLLADPRNFHNREKINFCVKNREWFRPFAPSVLEEEAYEWFSPSYPSPYMLYTQNILKPELIPAVTHVDNTARIQTVNQTMNYHYYNLIKEFFIITGVPMILNTSLNGGGEPLVETELDALKLFNDNDYIDILVLNGDIYKK